MTIHARLLFLQPIMIGYGLYTSLLNQIDQCNSLDSYLREACRAKKHALVSFPNTPTPSEEAIGYRHFGKKLHIRTYVRFRYGEPNHTIMQ